MLSFKTGKPFAVIQSGPNNGKTLRIHDNTNNNEEYTYDTDKLKQFNKQQLLELKDAIENNNDEYLTGKLKQVYNKIKTNGDIGTHYHDDNATLQIIPTDDPNQRDSIYVTGPSGSGKSYYIARFIEQYIKKYPDRNIILLSAKKTDPELDKYYPLRIPLDYDMVDDPIGLDELEKSLVIFDDIDQLGDKHIQNAVWNLRDRILEVGRSKGISICTVSHLLTNYKASRICLNEADYCVYYPRSGQRHQIQYFLKNYAGLDKQQIKKVFELNTRACVLKKTYPMCIIYQNGCYVV